MKQLLFFFNARYAQVCQSSRIQNLKSTLHAILVLVSAFGLTSCQNPATQSSEDMKNGLQTGITVIDTADRNNNFYDNVEVYPLSGGEILVSGEIENPGVAELSSLPKRSVITKEAILNDDGSNSFVGAYRYDGYSLFDILAGRILDKKNQEEFPPVIDLFVEVGNDKGDKVVLSWGEIYYANILNQILIATDVARIVPSKSKDLWPLPSERKLVVVNDLLSERNISNPTTITIRSCESSFPIHRNLDPLWAPEVHVSDSSATLFTLSGKPDGMQEETLHTIFYGRGRGIHSTQPFTGFPLKEMLLQKLNPGKKMLQQGLVLVVAADGYRCIFSFSEIMNRNDQADILLVPVPPGEEGGLYRLFPSCDFFSDRAVKAITEIQVR